MTAPNPDDPLVCINTRLVGGEPTCNQLEIDHCEGCRMCPGLGNCICRNATPLDKAWLAAALDAFAQHGGAPNWTALCDVISHSTAEHHRADVAAAVSPLQAEIRRLTAQREQLRNDLDAEIQDAPPPCFTEDDYAAGFIAGLVRASELAADRDPTAEVGNLKHGKETS